ncbi:hypothetical protein TIFTF001_039654 [Ficus carica]|uniref:Uncharacterized protein n=1 Tax=Ficus carica TaxID=3494 RepID=A0AA88ECN5_FICCA|nr:hypothetical protein TIFTF001_039654 [Ficus carica]
MPSPSTIGGSRTQHKPHLFQLIALTPSPANHGRGQFWRPPSSSVETNITPQERDEYHVDPIDILAPLEKTGLWILLIFALRLCKILFDVWKHQCVACDEVLFEDNLPGKNYSRPRLKFSRDNHHFYRVYHLTEVYRVSGLDSTRRRRGCSGQSDRSTGNSHCCGSIPCTAPAQISHKPTRISGRVLSGVKPAAWPPAGASQPVIPAAWP